MDNTTLLIILIVAAACGWRLVRPGALVLVSHPKKPNRAGTGRGDLMLYAFEQQEVPHAR